MLRVSWHVRHKAMCIGPGPWGCEDTCWPFPKCSPVLTGSPNSSMTRARLGLAAEPRELGASARCRCAYWPGFTQWTVASAISPGSLRSLSTLAMTFPGTKIPDGERAPLPSTRCGRGDLGGRLTMCSLSSEPSGAFVGTDFAKTVVTLIFSLWRLPEFPEFLHVTTSLG